MKTTLLLLSLSLCAGGATAGEPIVTTIIARAALGTNIINETPYFVWRPVTNVVDIPNGQAARVSMIYDGSPQGFWFEKNGLNWYVSSYNNYSKGNVIQGPARFFVTCQGRLAGVVADGPPGYAPNPSLLTVERWRVPKATAEQLRQ